MTKDETPPPRSSPLHIFGPPHTAGMRDDERTCAEWFAHTARIIYHRRSTFGSDSVWRCDDCGRSSGSPRPTRRVVVEWRDDERRFSSVIEVPADKLRARLDEEAPRIGADIASQLRRALGVRHQTLRFNLVTDGVVFFDCRLESDAMGYRIRIGRIG